MTLLQSVVLRNKKMFPLRPQNYRMNLSETELARYVLSVRDSCPVLGGSPAGQCLKHSHSQAPRECSPTLIYLGATQNGGYRRGLQEVVVRSERPGKGPLGRWAHCEGAQVQSASRPGG